MPAAVTLDELLKLAGLAANPATRPRRVADTPLAGKAPAVADPNVPPPIPASAQPPPRPMSEIAPNGAPPNLSKDEFANFGSSGEPFHSSRERRVEPRDYIADDLAYARDLERQKSPKWSNIATGITQGIAALEGNQPKQPWEFAGRTRKLNDIYGRLGKELGAQKEQAQIKSLGVNQDYRRQQLGGAQQKRMIDFYNHLEHYTRGENAGVDEMLDAVGKFPDKAPKAGKGASRKYHPPIFLPDGTAVQYNDATGEYGDALYKGESIVNPAMANVTATGATSGQEYTVKPGTALTAEAQAAGQSATQGRFNTSENRQSNQFATQEFHRRESEAKDTAEKWQKAYDDSRELKAAVDALIAKRDTQGGSLYGQDAINLATWPKMVETAQQRAQSLMDEVHNRHGDFYYIDRSGLHAKNPQPPSEVPPQSSAPAPTLRPKVNHAKFEKDYAAATTPEERAKLMKQYQEAIRIAGQQ